MRLRKFFWWSFLLFTFLAFLASINHYLITKIFNRGEIFNYSFTILATVLIGVYFSFQLSGLLQRLRDRVQMVARGELDEVVDFSRNEILEIHEIAKSMDDISAELYRRIDVIQRQKEELEAVLTSMDEGLVAVDKNHKITHFNPSAAQIFKVHRDQALEKKVEEVIRIPELHEMIKDGIESDQSGERDLLVTGEAKQYLRVHYSPLRNEMGYQYGVVLVASDVTRIRELEGMRKNFVANVSHELRTPLTSIQGFAETLADPSFNDQEQGAKFIGIINKHANRLARIIEDILTLSRIERDSEDHQIDMKKESIRSIVDTAIELCQVKAKKVGKVINLDMQSDTELNCDRYLIEQSIVNLVDNALRYSDESKEVDVRCFKDGQFICVEVQDYGMGIAERQLERIFERFYRVDRARSRELGGTGLGLSIVKHIAKAHHGEITVKSRVGEGSCFRLSLPVLTH